MKDIRPTSGKVLAALFSILGGKVEGAKFLDLFAGTGHVGLEALRHGASSCVFVESVRARAEDIRKVACPNDSRACDCVVLGLEVRRAVSWLVKRDMTFDVIFADPPYSSGWCDVLPAVKGLHELFADGAVMVIEHSIREPLTVNDTFIITSQREYGETCLTFIQRKEDKDDH